MLDDTITKGTTGQRTFSGINTTGYSEFIAMLDIADSSHQYGYHYNFSQSIPYNEKGAGFMLAYLNNIEKQKAKVFLNDTSIAYTEISAVDYDLRVRVYAR